ncbi:MAG TPA: alginate lyase family protein [Burkholderiales bacterium]|nr:alginate lyase family protein [Burkholderiales bacterium]
MMRDAEQATAPDAIAACAHRLRLTEAFSALSPVALARHFAARGNGHYFPVPDPDETRRTKIDAIMEGRFDFNGEQHVLDDPIDWLTNPSADVEWHILLHKFYFATGLGLAFAETGDAAYLRRWVALTSSWIAQTPPGFIAADVTGRRVQNWIYAYFYFSSRVGSDECPFGFLQSFLVSLQEQVEYLCAHLTPARNHRTLELYAIFLAGVAFPEFADAERWRAFALGEIVHNMQSDLLPDGVQCELSTDYHHLVLKNYLCVRRLAHLNGIAVPQTMDQRLVQALEFSLHAHKPDGIVPSLSDGDARSFLDLLQQGHELFGRTDMLYVASAGAQGTPPNKRAHGFTASGYYILRSGWGTGRRSFASEHYLIFDCGPLGAGNHGHLDALSFELAGNGRSLIVDPGRYTYSEAGEENWRVRFRGTAYHNTVTVDGRNQTRYVPKVVQAGTRHPSGSLRHRVVGSAPDCSLKSFVVTEGFDMLHGVARSHEYDAVHERRIVFAFGEYWILTDTMHALSVHRYDSWLHLAPEAQGCATLDTWHGTLLVNSPGLVVAHEDRDGIEVGLEQGYVSYRYGEKHAAPILRLTQQAASARFNTVLYPYCEAPPRITVREVAVHDVEEGSKPSAPRALEVQIGEGLSGFTDYFLFGCDPDRTVRFGRYTFRGCYLAMRKDATGELIELHTDRNARLEANGRRIGWHGLRA